MCIRDRVDITRHQLGGLPEAGSATIFQDRIHVETSASVSLPFGLMPRKLRETNQVIQTNAIQNVTSTNQYCPCDFFAAAGSIVTTALAGAVGVTADGTRGAVTGAFLGAAAGGVMGYSSCQMLCKERTDLTFKMADGSVEKVGVQSHEHSKEFVAALGRTMQQPK
eukprot:TRINITY_DN27623_c0_g1_i2.p1 TRINITY_DN27623_c0_g1~~TRINITY_DN27623_c0_g1_i2.p1  ORF type:complete len:166 (+),score=43.73 TRINITY_DN27623_c0_g1_i2:143-640(+)